MADSKVVKAALTKFRRTIHHATIPALFEARAAWIVDSELPAFISGAEGSICDAALVVESEDDTQLHEVLSHLDSTQRLLYVLQQYKNQKVLLPVDFKNIFPSSEDWRRGACYNYATGASPGQQQSDCGLYIIQNPAAPHLVAVVPRDFLDRICEERDGKIRYWRSIPIAGGKTEPFPAELSPFVIPISFLSQALKEYISFYHHPERGWRNPYNNIVFTDLSSPELHSTKVLLPHPTDHKKDFGHEALVFEAFHDHSTIYSARRLMIRPSVGDFQIVHLSTNTRVVVEVKHQVVKITNKTIKHSAGPWDGKHNRYFTPLTTWDYLLSWSSDKETALLVSRDDLPDFFFTDQISEEFEWHAGAEFIKEHTVILDQSNTASFVRDVERILNRSVSVSGLARTQMRRSFMPLTSAQTTALLTRKRDPAPPRELSQQQAILTMGKHWEARQERLIRRQCMKERFGAIYRCGRHPSGSYVFVPGVWKDNQPPRFHDLDLDATCFFLNFANVDYVDLDEPLDNRRSLLLIHATHGLSPSIYVISPYPGHQEGKGLRRWILPSTLMGADPERRRFNDYLIDPNDRSRDGRRSYPLFRSDQQNMDVSAQFEGKMVYFLKRLYLQGPGSDDEDGSQNQGDFDLTTLATTRREVIRQYVDLAYGKTFHAYRLQTIQSTAAQGDA